jgi:hypothetical protein
MSSFLVAVIFDYICSVKCASERATCDAQHAKDNSESAKDNANSVNKFAKLAKENADNNLNCYNIWKDHSLESAKHYPDLYKHAAEIAKYSNEIEKYSEESSKYAEESAKYAEECAQFEDESPKLSVRSAKLASHYARLAGESANHAAITYERALQSTLQAKHIADVQYLRLYTGRNIADMAKWVSYETATVSDILTELNSTTLITQLEDALSDLIVLYTALNTDPNANIKELTLAIDNSYKQLVGDIWEENQFLEYCKTRLSADRKYISSTLSSFVGVKAYFNTVSNASEEIVIMKALVLNSITVTTNHFTTMLSEMENMENEITSAKERIVAFEYNLKQAVPPIAAAA